MSLQYPKPFKTTEELVSLLIDNRGLLCESRDDLLHFLRNENYYRFTGYARQWQVEPLSHYDKFVHGSSFERIRFIMNLDHQLRHLLLEQISYVETAIRTRFAHEIGRKYGDTAVYLHDDFYNVGYTSRGELIDVPSELVSDIQRSRSVMVKHYASDDSTLDQYGRYEALPIWVAVEVLSFGKVVKAMAQVKDIAPVKQVAHQLSIQWDPFIQTLHSIVVLRNMCAHHSQLWHRTIAVQCPVSKKYKNHENFSHASIYATILMLNVYRKRIDGDTSTAQKILNLIHSDTEFSQGIMNPSAK